MAATCACGRPVPPRNGPGRPRSKCEVCSPPRTKAALAAVAANSDPPPATRSAAVGRVRTDVVKAARDALAELGVGELADPGQKLLGAVAERLAEDVDNAETVRDRVQAVRALVEVAERLDLVAPPPSRAGAAAPTARPESGGGEPDADNPFGVPDVPPGVGDTA